MNEYYPDSNKISPTPEQDARLIEFFVKLKSESLANVVYTSSEVFGGKSLLESYYINPETTLKILESSLDYYSNS
jgi:hypothetical protein